MRGLGWARRAAALSLLAAGLVGCGGTITYGSATPSPGGHPPGSLYAPSQPPSTPAAGPTPGTLLAFDSRTGAPLWQGQAPMLDMGQPVVADGMVFVPEERAYGGPPIMLAAFYPSTGDLAWRVATPVPCGQPSIGSVLVLVIDCMRTAEPPSTRAFVHALEPKTGRELWAAEGGAAAVGSGPVILSVPSMSPTGGFKVRGLNPLTGQQLWEATFTVEPLLLLVDGQVALVQQYGCATSTNPPELTGSSCPGPALDRSFVTRLDPATGSQLWQADFGPGGQVHTLLLGDVAVFSVNVGLPPALPPLEAPPPGAIGALDLATGRELWRQTLMTPLSVPFLTAPGTVYLEQPSSAQKQCSNNRLDALDSKSGILRWRLDHLQACEMTVDSDGQAVVLVLITSSGTKIMVLDPATGTELWEKPMATSGLYPLVHASVSGGVVYVAASGHVFAPSPPGD